MTIRTKRNYKLKPELTQLAAKQEPLSPHLRKRADRLAERLNEAYACPRAIVRYHAGSGFGKTARGTFWREVFNRVLRYEVEEEFVHNSLKPVWFYFGSQDWRLIDFLGDEMITLKQVRISGFATRAELDAASAKS